MSPSDNDRNPKARLFSEIWMGPKIKIGAADLPKHPLDVKFYIANFNFLLR